MSSSSASPSPLPSVMNLQIDGITMEPYVRSPDSSSPLFLGGGGLDSNGTFGFYYYTVIGVYLDANAIPSLSAKWKGKTTEELAGSVPFFRDIVTGAFEKFIKITVKYPLTGQQFTEKVTENWPTDCGVKRAVENFRDVFKKKTFPPGSSIQFAVSPSGSLMILFSKDDAIPEFCEAVINSKLLAEALLESVIGTNGVSPETRLSLAQRSAQLLREA